MAKILLIDDDKALATMFETALKSGGFEVIVSNDGNSGFDKAKSEKPDMIFLDQVLPDIPGNDILKKLKEDPDTKSIPISMLSNFGQQELMQEAINRGATNYILKYQIEPKDLIAKANEMLKESKPEG
ncbi:MAG: response regulator [Candidatus Levybacteria bacterium]|nr:response regulator [Candidatus Levybacteria bacterium]